VRTLRCANSTKIELVPPYANRALD
jgi:hypothetical protein